MEAGRLEAAGVVTTTARGKRLAVLAPGGIGAAVGGLLARAGHDVVLIDQWAAHVEAMRAAGLRMTIGTRQQPEGELTVPVRAYHLYEIAPLRPRFDVVFLTAKSYDTRWLVEFVKPYLAADGTLVSMQNSMNDEWIAPMIGAERDVACVLTGGGELLAPGHVWRNRSLGHPYYTLGELDGARTPRLKEVAGILGDAGKVRLSTNIVNAKWTKLIRNAQSAVASLCGQRSWNLLAHDGYVPTVANITREAIQVGAAAGYELEPINGLTASDLRRSPERVARAITEDAKVGGSDGSMNHVSQDLRRGRPTEVPFLNGLIARKGAALGLATPANAAVVDLFDELERGRLTPGTANLDLLNQRIRAARREGAARGGIRDDEEVGGVGAGGDRGGGWWAADQGRA
jgi:2-dehydropantoate 2-reductase